MKQDVSKYVGSKIKEIRRSKRLTQKELGERIGVAHNTVSSYESGTNEPEQDIIFAIAEVLGVSVNDLFPPINNVVSLVAESNTVYKVQEDVNIPFLGDVAAGALATVEGVIPENVEYLSIPKRFIKKYSDCKDLFAMEVNGDSMNKVIKDGSLVIAKPMESYQYIDGDIVIFSHDGEYSLKRFAPNDLEGFVLFKAESTDQSFKDIPVPVNTHTELKIYGKVVYYGITL